MSSWLVVDRHIVAEILFSVILDGYIQTLDAVSTRSKSQGLRTGDVCVVVLASFRVSFSINYCTGFRTQLRVGSVQVWGSTPVDRFFSITFSFTFCSSTWLNKYSETHAFTG